MFRLAKHKADCELIIKFSIYVHKYVCVQREREGGRDDLYQLREGYTGFFRCKSEVVDIDEREREEVADLFAWKIER